MRGPPVCLRDLSAEEASAVHNLARSRMAAARRVERARIVWRASQGETLPTIAETLGLSAETVRRRIRRFNAEGLAALEDHPRSGRPAADLLEHEGVAMRRSRTDETLLKAGPRWRRQETWFGERVDPEFAEKRGASRRSTRRRLPAA